MIGVRDLDRHAELRKPWNKAFGTGPLKDYEEMLVSRAGFLLVRLEELCDQAEAAQVQTQGLQSGQMQRGGGGVAKVDLAQWASFFAYVDLIHLFSSLWFFRAPFLTRTSLIDVFLSIIGLISWEMSRMLHEKSNKRLILLTISLFASGLRSIFD